MTRKVLLLLALLAAASLACKRSSSSSSEAKSDDESKPRPKKSAQSTPSVVILRTVATGADDGKKKPKLFLVSPTVDGEASPAFADLPGIPRAARTIDGGHALLVLSDSETGTKGTLSRVTTHSPPVVVATDVVGGLMSVSEDGGMALLSVNDSTTKTDTLMMLRLSPGAKPVKLMTFRYFGGGELAGDGRSSLISGTPTSCTATGLAACPMELWRATLGEGAEDAKLDPIRAGIPGAYYQPRFYRGHGVLGGDGGIVYQTTANDTSPDCLANLNTCRHDIVYLPGGDATATPEIVRKGGFGATFAPGGDRLAFLTLDEPESKCSKLPCFTNSLFVGDFTTRKFDRVVLAGVSILTNHAFSPDGEWLVFRGGKDVKDEHTIVCSADGKLCRGLGEGTPQGFLW